MALVSKEQIEAIEAKKLNYENEAKKLNKLIKAMQSICEHEWQKTGRHDSHKDEYECKICGKIEND